MKTIKDLDIKVTYRVGLGNIEVSDEVYEELEEIYKTGDDINGVGVRCPNALEWLKNHTEEDDCWSLEYEILEIS